MEEKEEENTRRGSRACSSSAPQAGRGSSVGWKRRLEKVCLMVNSVGLAQSESVAVLVKLEKDERSVRRGYRGERVLTRLTPAEPSGSRGEPLIVIGLWKLVRYV